jgi:alpha-ketoglutarate-dependent taurine dioxygenase
MSLTSIDLTPRIGAEIRTDKAALLSGVHAAEIRALLDRRGVVIARGIGFDDEEELAFGATLGAVRQEFGHKIMKVTLDKKENPEFADYFHATTAWHMDRTHEDVPPLASILTPRVLAPSGGETEFANMYAAYEDLPQAEKDFLEGVRIVHTKLASIAHTLDNPSEADLERLRGYGSKVHPAVWHHRSGRASIVMSASADHVVGMDREEGAALIQRLREWCARPQYVYQHQWRMGDLLIWDNTGTTHRVRPYDHSCGRRLHRVTLLGEERLAEAA